MAVCSYSKFVIFVQDPVLGVMYCFFFGWGGVLKKAHALDPKVT